MVHGLESVYWGQVDFVYIDREDAANQSVTQHFGVSYQPVFVLVHPDGSEVQRWFGAVPEGELRAALDGYLASNS